MKGEAKETGEGEGPALSELRALQQRTSDIQTTPSPPEPPARTHSPHVDETSAQERVQVPVYAGQAGDVEDLVAHSCREQEEDVQEPVPHLVPRPGAVLHTHTHTQK